MHVKVPGLKQEVGSGDLVKTALSSVGIHQKKGCGCKKIQTVMNRGLTFAPRASSVGVIEEEVKPTQ